MAFVNAKYKKEFVLEFKEACKSLGITQSEVFREAMIKTIERAKNTRLFRSSVFSVLKINLTYTLMYPSVNLLLKLTF